MVVIAIIGLLASIVLVSLNSARKKARDAKRIGDIKQIATAIEMFYDAAGTYPKESPCNPDASNADSNCAHTSDWWNAKGLSGDYLGHKIYQNLSDYQLIPSITLPIIITMSRTVPRVALNKVIGLGIA